MKRAIKLTYRAALILILAVSFFIIPLEVGARVARADSSATVYTDVMEDLQKDESFNVSDYPFNSKDYSLRVIQIAESNDGELFVYAYQPARGDKRTIATSINISTGINDNLHYKNYKLKLLNSSGIFFKYRVEGFTVLPDALRYYDISSIYRAWNKDIDKDIEVNVTNEVDFGVEKRYTVCTVGNEVSYRCQQPEYVTITDKYVGYVRYSVSDDAEAMSKWLTLGLMGVKGTYDCWYVAFSTDWDIDRLLEADIYYVKQAYEQVIGSNKIYLSKGNFYQTLTYKDSTEVKTNGFFNDTVYHWDRIMSAKDFIEQEDLTDTAVNRLSNKQWVLRFTETEYDNMYLMFEELPMVAAGIDVKEVTILRLKFETDGEVYNLGVIDNKQSPLEGQLPDNNQPKDDDDIGFWAYIWRCIVRLFKGTATVWEIIVAILAIFVVVALLPIILIVLSAIFPAFGQVLLMIIKAIGKGLLWLLKGLWWIISLPFRLIAAAVNKRKDGGENGSKKK